MGKQNAFGNQKSEKKKLKKVTDDDSATAFNFITNRHKHTFYAL